MLYIKQIMQLFNCDEVLAQEVRDYMCLDFSEASKESFEREAYFTYQRIMDRKS